MNGVSMGPQSARSSHTVKRLPHPMRTPRFVNIPQASSPLRTEVIEDSNVTPPVQPSQPQLDPLAEPDIEPDPTPVIPPIPEPSPTPAPAPLPLPSPRPSGPSVPLPAPRTGDTGGTTGTGGVVSPSLPSARTRAGPIGLPSRRTKIFHASRDARPVTFNDENCIFLGRNICNLAAHGAWLMLIAVILLIFLGIIMLVTPALVTTLLPIFTAIIGFLFPSPVFAPLLNKKAHTTEEADQVLEQRARAQDIAIDGAQATSVVPPSTTTTNRPQPMPSTPIVSPSANENVTVSPVPPTPALTTSRNSRYPPLAVVR